MRYETPLISSTQDSLRSSTWAFYPEWKLTPTLSFRSGAKLGFYPTFSPDSFRYKAEISYQPFYFIEASVRLTHETLLTTTATVNNGLYWVTLSPLPFEFVQIFASVGWYQRLILLSRATIVPSFRSSFTEHDFAFELGLKFKITDSIRFYLKAATFEELEVYNMNHPFGEIGGSYKTGWDNWQIYSFARYQGLLGFGRMDTFLFAIGAKTVL